MRVAITTIFFYFILSPFFSSAQNEKENAIDSSKFLVILDPNRFNNLNEILKLPQFDDKIVLIDLWGFGCATCHKEFRYLKAIKEKYETKSVAYLYIFLSNNIESAYWLKQEMYKFNLTGTHILADLQPDLTIFHGSLIEKMRSRTSVVLDKDEFAIPRFMLVDKKRNIVFSTAAKPSHKAALIVQIDKCLKK